MEDIFVIEHIQEICRERNWSIYKLAKESNIPYSSLNAMLKHRHIPTIYNLIKICNGFNISIYDFFNSELFKKDNIPTEDFLILWNQLSLDEKDLTKAYMSGLLHKKIDG